MSIRRKHFTLWLLLALVALRGLVPVGYMVDATPNGLAIVVCGSGIYAAAAQMPAAMPAGEHHHHHHHSAGDASEQSSTGASDHSICPFSMAATGSSAVSFPELIAFEQTVIGRVESRALVEYVSFGPSRAQQSRAPPALS